jgi:hypothetical protein
MFLSLLRLSKGRLPPDTGGEGMVSPSGRHGQRKKGKPLETLNDFAVEFVGFRMHTLSIYSLFS